VSVIAEDMVLAEGLLGRGADLVRYNGPVSVHTPIFNACRERGLDVVSLWGHAPVYVQTGNFRLILKIMDLIAALGGPKPDQTSLVEACQETESQIEALIQHSPKLANYVKQLRSSQASPSQTGPLLPKNRAKVIPLARPKKENERPT
ncbi:MAG: PAC2 family protein, partial [Deltaproteobacteria bacterium]|nr:PAC2 family protein [Deltaproteobacteria bacterium]